MRIAVASWTARYAGGIEAYLGAVIRALCLANHDLSFFHEVDQPDTRDPIVIDASVARFCVAARGADRAMELLVAWKPDVLYINGLHDAGTAERLLEIAPSVTFVHTYIGTCISGTKTHLKPQPAPCAREFGPACLAQYFPRRCGGRNPITMMRLYRSQSHRQRTLKRQAAVVTHSEHMKRELARHGVAATVMPFPISARGTAAPAAASADLLFAGRMDEVKGGLLLLDALPHVRRGLARPVRVRFAGDGPDRQQWEHHARRVHATDPQVSITFTGWSGETELSAHMQSSRLLVVPSVWPEPFGSVGIAAAQYGVPAAAFAVGGIPQWLEEGVNGHLAPGAPPTAAGLADAIVRCLRDPQHYADLSMGARRVSARFTMDRHLPELMNCFTRVVHGRS